MKYLLFLFIFLSLETFAKVEAGDVISSVDYNNSKFTIGDIKTSLLTEAEFQTLHGNCWIKLNNGVSGEDIDISNSDLAQLKENNFIKNSSGRVLRAEGGNSLTLGEVQEDAFQGHRHGQRVPSHDGINIGPGGQRGIFNGGAINSFDFVLEPKTDGVNGIPRTANETRMANLTVNMFVKINHSCN